MAAHYSYAKGSPPDDLVAPFSQVILTSNYELGSSGWGKGHGAIVIGLVVSAIAYKVTSNPVILQPGALANLH